MRKLSYIRIALLIICSLFTTPFCFAQSLAVDSHIPESLTYSEWVKEEGNILRLHHYTAAMVSVSIDEFTYDPSSNGVANLDGSFYIMNYHPRNSLSYTGEIRMEIFKPTENGDLTYLPHAEKEVSGYLKSWNENRDNDEIIDDFSESLSLNIDCLSGPEDIDEDDRLKMSASITLRATIRNTEETWSTTYTEEFTHSPTSDHGLGPTTDGETFSGDCSCTGSDEWDSLMITEKPYDMIYWYVKGPGDTSAYGTVEDIVEGDGVERSSVFTYTFPEEDGLPGTGSFYEITAYVYSSDGSVYWESYSVWVEDD